MKARSLVLIVILVSISSFWGCGNKEQDLDKVSVRLPIPVADAAFSPYYLAIDKGYYKREGLDVTLEPGTPELNPVRMVGQGTNAFGVVGGPELLLSGRAGGAEIVGISLLHKNSDFVVIVTLKESNITRVEQLQGRRVGFFYGHISTDILNMFFNKTKVRVSEVDVGFDYGLFLSGDLAGQWAFRTTAGINLPERGIALNLISPAAYGIETHGHVIIANESVVNTDPDIVQRFIRGTLDGLALSVKDVNAAVDATMRRDPNFLRKVGLKQMEVYVPTIQANEKLGWIDKGVLERSYRQMRQYGLLDRDVDISRTFNSQFVEAYHAEAR